MNAELLREFRSIVGSRGVISSPQELRTYECDGLTNFRVVPPLSCFPIPWNKYRPWCVFAIASGSPLSRAAPEQV